MTPLLRGILSSVFLLLAATATARAQDAPLSLAPGHVARLVLKRAFETVMIGDPDVVGVRVNGDRSVVIDALNPGVTNLVLVDAAGMVTANIRVLVCAAWSSACDGWPLPPAGSDLASPPSIRRDARDGPSSRPA
jgi:Flp pilus assembly secretin CpaC